MVAGKLSMSQRAHEQLKGSAVRSGSSATKNHVTVAPLVHAATPLPAPIWALLRDLMQGAEKVIDLHTLNLTFLHQRRQ